MNNTYCILRHHSGGVSMVFLEMFGGMPVRILGIFIRFLGIFGGKTKNHNFRIFFNF